MSALKIAIKNAAVRSGLFGAASRMGARKVAVLRYHSVLVDPAEFGDSIGLGIIHSSRLFREHMELIASRYHPVSVNEICAFVRGEADVPPHSVAITFDDGFADNLEVAAPILARYAIPAAIYVAVDYIGNSVPPWYVRLRYAFSTSKFPEWRVENTVFDMREPGQRHQAFLDSSRKCAKLCRNPQEKLLAEIEAKLEVEPFRTPIMLTWGGVRELLAQGHIIGSHTLSHPNLAYVDETNRKEEMVASKVEIEKHTQSEIAHFSYPSPIMEPHYCEETIAITKAAKYRSAVTCNRGAVVQGDDALSLKRIYAPQTLTELEWALENAFIGRLV